MGMKSETLLFLHIPKAAGTTLSRVIERHIPARAHYRLGANAQAAVQRYNEMPAADRARYQLISGHFPYGVHEQVPGAHAYFTLLREPVDRTASFYYFLLQHPRHPLHRAMSPAQRGALAEYARTTRDTVMDNGQTRLLAGDWGTVPFGACTPAMLQQAKRNLATMDVVGLTERFDATLLLLGQRFGWTQLGYRRANRNRVRPPRVALSPAERLALLALNELDVQLYAYAAERFQQAWEKAGLQDVDFEQHYPPPSRLHDWWFRLKARPPSHWGNKVARRLLRR